MYDLNTLKKLNTGKRSKRKTDFDGPATNAAKPKPGKPDISFADHGTIWLVKGITPVGNEWIAENVQTEDALSLGGAIAVEHRYIGPIIEGAIGDGLAVGG